MKPNNVLSLDQMLPVRFVPLRKHHFIVEIPGIDSFLVKNIFISSHTDEDKNQLKLKLHDTIEPSALKQAKEWQFGGAKSVTVKKLDAVGAVLTVWRFEQVVVERLIQEMSYDSNELSEILLVLKYDSEQLEY